MINNLCNNCSDMDDDSKENDILRDITETGSVLSKNKNETIRCMTIIGQIEGHYLLGENQKASKYEHIIPLLVTVEESDEIDGLLLLLNTMGGDVEAGLAIAELIAGMTKPTASIVLGGGHSIGVPLAVSTGRSFIVPSATMTIHPVRMNGTVIGVPQTYFYFDRMQNRIIDFVTSHSSISPELLRDMMLKTDELANDVGSIIDGNTAVECGLIDEIGSLSAALSYLRQEIEKTHAES